MQYLLSLFSLVLFLQDSCYKIDEMCHENELIVTSKALEVRRSKQKHSSVFHNLVWLIPMGLIPHTVHADRHRHEHTCFHMLTKPLEIPIPILDVPAGNSKHPPNVSVFLALSVLTLHLRPSK